MMGLAEFNVNTDVQRTARNSNRKNKTIYKYMPNDNVTSFIIETSFPLNSNILL